MIGSIIGAGIQSIGAIAGGIASSVAARKANKQIEEQREKNQNWYDRRYNEDSTQRVDAQRILNETEERIKARNKAAAGAAAVAGGTEESVAANKAANNEALADATAQIAAQGEARKDAIEATYLQNDNAFNQQQVENQQKKAQAIGQAVQGVAQAGASIASSFIK